jgi:hypothetical protein
MHGQQNKKKTARIVTRYGNNIILRTERFIAIGCNGG